MNRLKARFFLTVLVVLYILYSQYIYHTYADTRKAGIIQNSYKKMVADPLYRLYAYWECIIQHIAQPVELSSWALYDEPAGLESY